MAESTRDIVLSLSLAGGAEQLKPIRLDAHEGLSQSFRITVDVLAQGPVPLLKNLGKPCAIQCKLDGELIRHFHGHVIDACHIDEQLGAGMVYRLTLAPKSYFHEQGSKYRIFQNKPPMEIVKQVLGECGIAFKPNTSLGTRPLLYCVQYGESDFDFCCRLLEEEGIYYYYHHTAGNHEMVICDKPASHPDVNPSVLNFNSTVGSVSHRDSNERGRNQDSFIQGWQEFASSRGEKKVLMRDWDFKVTTGPIESFTDETKAHDEDEIEVHRWPGRYYTKAVGDPLTKTALESLRAMRVRYEGLSYYTGIQAGFRFTLTDHPHEAFNKKYLITECRIQLADELYRSGNQGGATQVHFTAIRDNVKFRVPLQTPRPIVRGPETATVVGPPGEEIYVDEFGRIKVQFHWDRAGKSDANSSCWLRVSQPGVLGTVTHPRIGEEVLVDFIAGNPDRPLVVGRVYNEANKSKLYGLPAKKTMTVLRTKTYKKNGYTAWPGTKPIDVDKGCQRGGSEIRIDDDTQCPQMFIYAERHLDTRVSDCETHKVGQNQTIIVRKDRTEEVHENEKVTIDGKRDKEIKKTETIKVIGNRTTNVGDGPMNMSKDVLEVVSDILTTSTMGDIKTDATMGNVKITAMQSIKLICGPSEIELTPAGITMKGLMVTVEGTTMATVKSPLTTVKATGLMTVSGAIVKIN